MKVLLLFAVLLVCFACAYAITCTACMEMISDDPNFQPPADPSAASCSGNPGETVCDESVSSCMTIMTTMEFTRDASSLTLTQTNRDCAPPAGLPAGDTCADQTTIDVFKANIPDPAPLFPPELGLTFENLDISICVCDSADTCTPPSPVTDAASQPEPEPTANADGKGYAITCTTCMEMTSDDPNFQPPADPSAASCSDNLGETVCDEGVRSCVTMMTTMEFTRDASSLTLTQTHRDCAPPAGLPAGDTCADQTTVDMLTANVPDPATLFPPELGLTFENLDVSICVCDSADRCTPPSPATDARPQPEPVPTANADGQEPRTPKPAPSCTITDIRLVDGNTEVEGRVEIMYRGQWGTVCDDDWDMDDALVVCRMLGFDGASQAVVSAQFGQGSGPIILDDVMCLGNEATLADCPHPPFGQHNCDHSKDAGVACFTIVPTTAPTATEPTITGIRLVGSTSANEGRVEILYNGEWGTICDDSWDLPDAVVTCRMLGFEGASLATTQAQFGRGSGDIWLDEVRCSGEEASLAECSHREFGEHNCWHGEDAGVVCVSRPTTTTASTIRITTTTATTTSATTQATTQVPSIDGLRLVGGSSDNEGRVEILYNGQWGTVCDDLWGLADASVVCRMLEFDGASEAPGFARFGQGSDPIWLDNVRCTGNETHLAYCQHSSFGQHNCQHDEDAGVVCFTTKPTTTLTPPTPSIDGIRLTGGIVDNEGIVEILVNGQWGTVCGNYWSYDDARVVCRMMGYTGAQRAVGSSRFRQASGPIHIHNVLCWGNEKSLIDCGGDLFGPNNCTHSQDAGVICYPWRPATTPRTTTTLRPTTLAPSIDYIRLVDGSSGNEGRVEILYEGQWGTVCDDSWDLNDASVVCRMLGFDGASEAAVLARFGQGSGPILLDDVMCLGNEDNLADCPHPPFGENNCWHGEDAGVVCIPSNLDQTTTLAATTTTPPPPTTPTPRQVRLVGGNLPFMGRVEVSNSYGHWGSICDYDWTRRDANVVCRMLGYDGASSYSNNAEYGESRGRIHLDDVTCVGWENNIASCQLHDYSGWGCDKDQEVGVRCNVPEPSEFEIRLVGGSNPWEGRVELLYLGQWGTICSSFWGKNDGDVACRMLGYSGAYEAISPTGALYPTPFGEGTGTILLSDFRCTGTEENLADCSHSGWGDHNCYHYQDAGLVCNSPDPDSVVVRLVNGSSRAEGRVEVLYEGEFGTVCDDSWDIYDASVVCRMLGYEGASEAPGYARFGQGSGDIVLDDVVCLGSENNIASCEHRRWGTNNCAHTEDAGVICTGELKLPVRLVNGNSANEGRVEIFRYGAWGSVCDDWWDINDGNVVCRMLGYARAERIWWGTNYGPGSGKILLDNVECSGSEATLDDCVHPPWGVHDCNHYEDAGVVCVN